MKVKMVNKLHLWLGLSSGLVVFIIAVTGCIYAFQQEIQDLTQPYRFTEQQKKSVLLPSQIEEIAEGHLSGKHAHSVIYNGNGRSAKVVFYSKNPEYYYHVYINPYTGELLKVKDMHTDFFSLVLKGHFYLWLPPAIGQPVVATATLIFVVMLVSGIILWWPKNKNGKKQRFTIRWNARWRRRNYDLHNVLGFYIFGLALILALTGLVWGFDWFANAIYTTASGGKEMIRYYEPTSDTTVLVKKETIPAVDKVWMKVHSIYPLASSIEVHYPDDHKATIGVNVNPDEGTYWKRDFIYFDQYTLKEVEVDHMYGRFHNAQFEDKLYRLNYDIHVGAILGFPGKLLAFCVSLVVASLPVTGFYVWWGRKKKQAKKSLKRLHQNDPTLKPAIL